MLGLFICVYLSIYIVKIKEEIYLFDLPILDVLQYQIFCFWNSSITALVNPVR